MELVLELRTECVIEYFSKDLNCGLQFGGLIRTEGKVHRDLEILQSSILSN